MTAVLVGQFLYGDKAKSPFGSKAGSYPTKDTRTALGAATGPGGERRERAGEEASWT